jgi:hypothetical protein
LTAKLANSSVKDGAVKRKVGDAALVLTTCKNGVFTLHSKRDILLNRSLCSYFEKFAVAKFFSLDLLAKGVFCISLCASAPLREGVFS